MIKSALVFINKKTVLKADTALRQTIVKQSDLFNTLIQSMAIVVNIPE